MKTECNVYILLETVAGTDGIRDTYVKAVSTDKNKVIAELEKAIEEDEYGYIERNGVYEEDMERGYFLTNVDDGFVEYNTVSSPLL